jgi:NADH-quinone oxidoreductase subunit A
MAHPAFNKLAVAASRLLARSVRGLCPLTTVRSKASNLTPVTRSPSPLRGSWLTVLLLLLPATFLSSAESAPAAVIPTTFDIVFPLTILLILGLSIPTLMLLANHVLSRWALGGKNSNPGKIEPYESGLNVTLGSANERFSVKFYLVAMLFLAFDLEVAFLYPWAIHFSHSSGWSMVWLLVIFLVMLEVGYLYLYKKGALDWDR